MAHKRPGPSRFHKESLKRFYREIFCAVCLVTKIVINATIIFSGDLIRELKAPDMESEVQNMVMI